jgi:acyl-CoA hydrolase
MAGDDETVGGGLPQTADGNGSHEYAIVALLAAHIRPGDHIIWGQGPGEPLTLSRAIVAGRHRLGVGGVFVGAQFSDTLQPEAVDGLPISSYGTLGNTRPLAASGHLDIIPCHVSRLAPAIRRGEIRCDVALVQLSAPGPDGQRSMGAINDYIRAAIETARIVIVEENDRVPWTHGPPPPDLAHTALAISSSLPLAELHSKPPSLVERAIGRHIADLVPDGATLQVGIGGTIDAMLACLGSRKDLGVHSGAIGDGILDLIEKGVVTNASKPIDRGVTVTAGLFGTQRLFAFADRNPRIEMRPYDYTHDAAVLAQIPNLIAVNSAIEVDITGQVNAEFANGRYIGAVGGQVDFMHAATRSTEGFSVIALPSTAAGGAFSRIRPHVETVTCPRSEVDFVVTEHGIADLRGQSLRERQRRMIAIADPRFQPEL